MPKIIRDPTSNLPEISPVLGTQLGFADVSEFGPGWLGMTVLPELVRRLIKV